MTSTVKLSTIVLGAFSRGESDERRDENINLIPISVARGHDLQATLSSRSKQQAMSAIQQELEEKAHHYNAPLPTETVGKQSTSSDARGLVFVDATTHEVLGSTGSFKAPAKDVSATATLNEKQLKVATMTTPERSKALWRRVAPGVMDSTIQSPMATTAETFSADGRPRVTDPHVDKRVHRQKTDFSEYLNKKIMLQM